MAPYVLTRRSLIRTGGVLAATSVASARGFSANEKISVACIGIRGRGNSVMGSFLAEPDCEVTHLCDVREEVLTKRGEEVKAKSGRMPTRLWSASFMTWVSHLPWEESPP